MEDKLLYLDSSALVKLVVPEKESGVLLESLSVWPVRVTSYLARVEVMRAARRATERPGTEKRAEEVMAGLTCSRWAATSSARRRLEPRIVDPSTPSTWPRPFPWEPIWGRSDLRRQHGNGCRQLRAARAGARSRR